MQTLDQLYAVRKTAGSEIARLDKELIEHPNSPALAEARTDWARLSYLVDAELERRARVCAYQSEAGVQATCPTTGETYISERVQYTRIKGQKAVWCTCRCCDVERRTRIDREFDPSQPQRHLYFVGVGHV